MKETNRERQLPARAHRSIPRPQHRPVRRARQDRVMTVDTVRCTGCHQTLTVTDHEPFAKAVLTFVEAHSHCPEDTGTGECVVCDGPITRDDAGEWWHDNPRC